jgi:hypothetical protein
MFRRALLKRRQARLGKTRGDVELVAGRTRTAFLPKDCRGSAL